MIVKDYNQFVINFSILITQKGIKYPKFRFKDEHFNIFIVFTYTINSNLLKWIRAIHMTPNPLDWGQRGGSGYSFYH